MPQTAALDPATVVMNALGRALAFTFLLVGAALGVVFAFAAAMVAGLLVLGAAIAMRFAPKRARAAAGPETLNARRTPDGWVVETRLR